MASKPNILLIITDEHSPQVSGFAGDPYVNTDNLDALATRSTQFHTASCPSPACTPSRMSFLTGKEPHRCSAWNNHWILFPEHVTWPGHFAEHGYTTALVGKMHFGGKDQMHGFQYRPYGDLKHGLGHQPDPLSMFPGYNNAESAGITEIPESLIQEVVTTRETLAFILEHHDQKPHAPWFVCASYCKPHSPLTTPGRYIRRYRGRIPAIEHSDDAIAQLEPFARWIYDRLSPQLTLDEIQLAREAYYACVDFVDDCIGELITGLERAGTLDNTIIIYSSDHGEMSGLHGLWGKGVYYEQSMGVPLLMTGPGIKLGHHDIYEPISLTDLFPTCCDLAGLPIPEDVDGVNFGPLLSGQECSKPPRDFATSQYLHWGTRVKALAISMSEPCRAWRAIRTRQWKYVDVQGGSPLLFDMENDPNEMINLADPLKYPQHATRCVELREKLFRGFSWEQAMAQYKVDLERVPEYSSGIKPSTPNQYMLPDGRIFDAESELYGARWLPTPDVTGGIIPQQLG